MGSSYKFVIPRTPVLDASSKSCTSHQHYYVQKENYMNIFTDKIDKLEAKQVKLESSKEEKTSKINAKNNRIGARVKRLEEKMYMNRLALDKFLAKTDLELERNAKMITAEHNMLERLVLNINQLSINQKTEIVKTVKILSLNSINKFSCFGSLWN